MAFKQRPKKQGLYDPAFEHDACGVGFIAHIKGDASHSIVKDAEEILIRMTHRGAVGAEKNTGDGAGILTSLPHEFLRKAAKKDLQLDLPAPGTYGAGIVFFPQDDTRRSKCLEIFQTQAEEEDLELLGWREVPTNNTMIGPSARESEPVMKTAFLKLKEGSEPSSNPQDELEKRLYILRKRVTNSIRGTSELDPDDFFYVCSLSSRVMVYKGMLMPEQLFPYFPDLDNKDFTSHLAMVHSRFSTNTFPSWDRAQPLRYMSHNGEINTLRGNVNKMRSREGTLKSEFFGPKLASTFPVNEPDLSDSGNFDNVLELLIMAGRKLPEAVMMMIPEAWQRDPQMDPEKRAMYEYFSNMMEPWDGPASVVFTDGTYIGATLDRNGLRPSRYYVTDDDRVIMASEVGVLDIPEDHIVAKGRLQPGKMFLVNFNEGRIIDDNELKSSYSGEQPYGTWLEEKRITLDEIPAPEDVPGLDERSLLQRLKLNGFTWEHLREVLKPMAELAKEPLGSMGNDAPLAVLSDNPRMLYDYFKQLFAQVTNPPIDSVRESVIMSLKTYIGPEGNLLEPGADHAHRLMLEEPVLTNDQLAALKHMDHRGWRSKTLDITYPVRSGKDGLMDALERISREAEQAIADGASLVILSDRNAGRNNIPLPALLAVGSIHQYLVSMHKRTQIGLVLESAEPREVHHFCTLTGYGADAVNPYLAFEAMWKMQDDGQLDPELSREQLADDYLRAIEYGMQKVFAKMGISTLESYKGAQIFEAVGLASEVVERCFTGTASRIEGADFQHIAEECQRRHNIAYPDGNPTVGEEYLNPGDYSVRHGGEGHMWDAESIANLQIAVRSNDVNYYKAFSRHQDQRSQRQYTLRGLLRFKEGVESIPIEEVEPIESIMTRFASGAMSFGSISQEAHETLAIAMNRVGGKSNTGEGGEMPERFKPLANGDSKRSAIKQVASGRFGVTNEYLTNADEIQIKMAQGAKPGEGGELPGHKVFEVIAKTRHTTKGVGLISPPPHHDIYSIEDLAQLIFDLKNSNPKARISVKLVSKVGVGTIAAGVAKGHADHILISGHDGGTGASPLTGIKHAGLPWELGLAETHQTLVMNDLRSRVVIQTDGQLKTGRDVVIAAILGAEEFGFATSALITMGCIMMRKCQKNTCPVGVATQDERLRKKFTGKPEHVVNFLKFIAQEARELMAQLGVRSINELIGRVDLVEADDSVRNWKSEGIDLSSLLNPPKNELARTGTICCIPQDHGIADILDRRLIELSRKAISMKKKVELELGIKNTDRAVGTMLSHEIAKRYGFDGLPENTLDIKLRGHAGQSFGGWLASGVTLELEGDANDYVGKGLSGGTICIYPPKHSRFQAEENIIIGNVAFYGAITGKAFIRGMAAERFCVRNSGAKVVIEGVGDHGCEYMTGGRAVILGEAGRNFGAGMSGGIAYVWDQNGTFRENINPGMIDSYDLITQEAWEIEEVKTLIEEHLEWTGSTRAQDILDNWEKESKKFVKVISPAYAKVLELEKEADREAVHG
ncbi:glutamate synthase large subunit [Salinispira pacifica]|uniref:Glutamate synthase [NADPH] large chain n=1 Tax=Salinispira pacifica TaxID=1307761 RepID=V5WGB1_9SPIO|nr:glutamate synthase large subunit [Salinispira pacifica]AHC14828.1 Glutamate synthase [NADPH] large chain [Salinispira pacifica]